MQYKEVRDSETAYTELRRFCEGKFIRKISQEKREILKSNLTNITRKEMEADCKEERCQIK